MTAAAAARMGVGAVVVLAAAAGLFRGTVTAMGVLFPRGPALQQPLTVPASSHAPPKGRPPHHHRRAVAPASLSPVSAVPIRTRHPSPAPETAPARTTPRPPVSVPATQPPAPTASSPPAASVAPSTAITAPTLPGTGSGLP